MLIDRVPQPQLGGDAIVEPVQQRQAVASLGRRREAEQLDRLDVIEERAIRRRGRVMEFIDDDDVEVLGVEGSEAGRVEALDRREDVLELPRPLPADPQLSERMIAQRVTKRRQALFEDLLAMRDEQQSRAREAISKPRVVDRGHDGLACAGRGDEQVAMVPTLARERDLLEQALLERFGPKLDRTEEDHEVRPRRAVSAANCRGVIRHEIAAVPIALEHRRDLVDDVRISRAGHPDVPFEAADLRRVRQIRRADVGRREARPAMKQPGLGVQARGAHVVRHADVRPELARARQGPAPSVDPV